MGAPSAWRVEGEDLLISDAYGRRLWSSHFDQPLLASEYLPGPWRHVPVWFGDVEGDGEVETLFAFHSIDRARSGTALLCFSQRGGVKWRFQPGGEVAAGGHVYSHSYLISQFQTIEGPNHTRRIVVTSRHATEEPNQVAILSPAGSIISEYWHSGHLRQLAVVPVDGGERLLLGGRDHIHDSATLVILNPKWPSGCPAGQRDPALLFANCGARSEEQSILFPRSCVSLRLHRNSEVSWIRPAIESYEVGVSETGRADEVVEYSLNRQFNVTAVSVSNGFSLLHDQLARSGVLDHSYSGQELDRLRAGVEYQ